MVILLKFKKKIIVSVFVGCKIRLVIPNLNIKINIRYINTSYLHHSLNLHRESFSFYLITSSYIILDVFLHNVSFLSSLIFV